MKKTFPNLTSDEAAENFVNDADLSEYDFSGFTHIRFEFMPKNKHVNLRMPEPLLRQVKARAKEEGIPYQRISVWPLSDLSSQNPYRFLSQNPFLKSD